MRINNPKTTAGGLPLATTWYVNHRLALTKDYVDNVSAFLSGYTDTEVFTTKAESVARDNALSAMSDVRDSELISAFCRYITGSGVESDFVHQYIPTLESENPAIYYAPKAYGYAYLAANKKIAPELMPDISIMDVNVADVKDIFTYLRDNNYLAHDGELYATLEQGGFHDLVTVLSVVKRAIEIYVLKNQSRTGNIKAVGQGDVIVITNFGKDEIDNATDGLATAAYSPFKDVFSQSFMCGGWICNAETRIQEGENAGLNASISYVKISYNQGEIISLNGLLPEATGNVTLTLPNLYRRDGQKIGEVLARNLEKVKSTDSDSDSNAMRDLVLTGGLVDPIDVSGRFVFDDDVHGACYAYATINEYMNLNIATETARAGLSAAIDAEVARANAAEQYLSGVLDAEIERSTNYDNYLSAVVGTEAALSGVSVTDALVALKQHADTTAANVTELKDIVNTEDYDVVRVFTKEIPAGTVANAASLLTDLAITAVSYKDTYHGWNDDGLADNNIYNYFGFKPSFAGANIAEITFSGFKGRILDIYAVNDGKFEKIDADIEYTQYDNEGITVTTSSFKILGEYVEATEGPTATVIDKLVVRYTDKFTYEPADTNPLFS